MAFVITVSLTKFNKLSILLLSTRRTEPVFLVFFNSFSLVSGFDFSEESSGIETDFSGKVSGSFFSESFSSAADSAGAGLAAEGEGLLSSLMLLSVTTPGMFNLEESTSTSCPEAM